MSVWAQAMHRGVSDALNTLGGERGCRPLNWCLGVVVSGGSDRDLWAVSGAVGADAAEDEVDGLLARWVEALGLAAAPRLSEYGTVKYRGSVPGARLQVQLWGIVDRARWDAAAARPRPASAAHAASGPDGAGH